MTACDHAAGPDSPPSCGWAMASLGDAEQRFRKAADALGPDSGPAELLARLRRAVEVSLSVRMDDGRIVSFSGYATRSSRSATSKRRSGR